MPKRVKIKKSPREFFPSIITDKCIFDLLIQDQENYDTIQEIQDSEAGKVLQSISTLQLSAITTNFINFSNGTSIFLKPLESHPSSNNIQLVQNLPSDLLQEVPSECRQVFFLVFGRIHHNEEIYNHTQVLGFKMDTRTFILYNDNRAGFTDTSEDMIEKAMNKWGFKNPTRPVERWEKKRLFKDHCLAYSLNFLVKMAQGKKL